MGSPANDWILKHSILSILILLSGLQSLFPRQLRLISDESVIRNNRVIYSIEKECIVSIITQSEGLQNENIL